MPMLPAAPRTSTLSPGANRARSRAKWATTPEPPRVHRGGAAQAVGQYENVLDRGDGLLRVPAGEAGQRPHPPSDPRGVHPLPHRGDPSRDLAAEEVALPEAVGGQRSPADHGVHAAHPDRFRGDPHLPRSGNGRGHINDLQAVGVPERPDDDGFHVCSSARLRPRHVVR
ncbi:hypothetical protein GCM10018785_52990 [Streptomyces longispororuber]|uniref:Uncharacterized protein n=1 Tax=Streptomyces longispororuber TaxID=68230 RepID=A0A919A0P4_9ACTN|nr:hypothetical protein GCM10018785_52990 [Streptomyces longispororuber]